MRGSGWQNVARRYRYLFFSVDLRLLRSLAALRFLRVTLCGSNDFRLRASEMIPSCWTLLLNRRSMPSKLSPSRFLTSTKWGSCSCEYAGKISQVPITDVY